MKTTSLIALLIASVQLTGYSKEANTNGNPAKEAISTSVPPTSKTEGELAAWQQAEKVGTPTAFKDFYLSYPDSARIKKVVGTLRARYWLRMNDQQHRDGILITIEGMNVLKYLSVEEAVSLNVINSRPAAHGEAFTAKGMTFNYVYVEITDGYEIRPSMSATLVIWAKDIHNSTIILSADGTHILTWDLNKAKVAAKPDTHPTFLKLAAAEQPFNDVPDSIDKTLTPESQGVTCQPRYK